MTADPSGSLPPTVTALMDALADLDLRQIAELDRRGVEHWRRHGDAPFGRAVTALRATPYTEAEDAAVEYGCGFASCASDPIIAEIVRGRISEADYRALREVWDRYVADGCPESGTPLRWRGDWLRHLFRRRPA